MQTFVPIDVVRMREVLIVDPTSSTGLRWRTTGCGRRLGRVAGGAKTDGYFRVSVGSVLYLAHRVVWAVHSGEDPGSSLVDHANGDTQNNDVSNLRLASTSQNARNRRGANCGSSSPFMGVCWHAQRGKWRAQIHVDGKQLHLGVFTMPEAAARARDDAAVEHFGEFASLNFPH